jgi:DNA (cytosine-5)-methyltransferase 1
VKAFVGFAGFGGADIALREFGFEVTGVEIDDAIAEVNRVNGGYCLTANILDVDPSDYAGYDLMHFSPPCPNFSQAKVGGSETEIDLQLARKICEFVRIGQPVYFTLENVWGYRKSLSWLLIWYTLIEEGYGVDGWHLNAADYGIAQSRKRMIVIARRDGRQPARPFPTHARVPDMFTDVWRGWYEAIEDLIPELPETQFANWQLDKLTDIDSHQTGVKAFVINSQNTSNHLATLRTEDNPMFVVTANALEKGAPPKAFVVDCQYKNFGNNRELIIRKSTEPVFTMTASANRPTIRAWLNSGKVVSMTPRALARFQDFPDWFKLPGGRELACRGIGNAVPPGLYRAVLGSLGLTKNERKK